MRPTPADCPTCKGEEEIPGPVGCQVDCPTCTEDPDEMARLLQTVETLKDYLKGEQINCAHCGDDDVPATCIGEYEGHGGAFGACDDCCGHGNEDGWCYPLVRS